MYLSKNSTVNIGVFVVLSFYSYCIYLVVANFYAPATILDDGIIYNRAAELFYLTSRLDNLFYFKDISDSIIGVGDYHGIMYNLLNGTIAKIVGWSGKGIIYTNIFFMMISGIIIFSMKSCMPNNKLLFLAIFLSTNIIYCFSYLQEAINILFAIILSVLLIRIYAIDCLNRGLNVKIFIAVIIIAFLFRPSFIFWIVALYPLLNSGKKKIYFGLLFFGLVILSFIYVKLTHAPYPYSVMSVFFELVKISGLFVALTYLFENFINNIDLYFWSLEKAGKFYGAIYTLFIPSFIFVSVLYFFKNSTKLSQAVGLIFVVHFLFTATVYDMGYTLLRNLFPIIIAVMFVIFFEKRKSLSIILISVLCVNSPIMASNVFSFINEHIEAGKYEEANKEGLEKYKNIANYVHGDKKIVIYFHEDIYKDKDLYSRVLFIPYTNKEQKLIVGFSVFKDDPLESKIFSEEIDYIFSLSAVERGDVDLVSAPDDGYYLYKIRHKAHGKK